MTPTDRGDKNGVYFFLVPYFVNSNESIKRIIVLLSSFSVSVIVWSIYILFLTN